MLPRYERLDDSRVASSSSPSFGERVVDDGADGPRFVSGADVDGDGDVDVVAASMDQGVLWFERVGGPREWVRRSAASAENAISVALADFDGDGDVDAITCEVSTDDDQDVVILARNDGAEPCLDSDFRGGGCCSKGQYVDEDGACAYCPAGTYMDLEQHSRRNCTAVPPGSVPARAAQGCRTVSHVREARSVLHLQSLRGAPLSSPGRRPGRSERLESLEVSPRSRGAIISLEDLENDGCVF